MGEQKRKKRQLWHKSPYDGVPGFFPAILRLLYQFQGASQLGDRNEPPYVPPANPTCPICQQLMRDHRIDRSTTGERTRLRCP